MIIPVYFSIDSIKVENGILKIELLYDDNFKDLQINIIGYSSDYRTKLYREKLEVEDQRKIGIPLRNLYPNCRLEVYLLSRSLPELQIKETIFVPIDQPLIPFTQTYNQFHKLVELERILTSPETLDSRNRSEQYEKAVCDLFSLCGLSTIHLDEHEILQLENKTQIGSADILAYDGIEHLFVIDCDIMVPDIKKMENLKYLCRYLEKIPEIGKVQYVIPVIVSPNPSSSSDTGVLVLAGEMIRRLFKAIHYQNKGEIVSMITSAYFQLQLSRTTQTR